MNRNLLFTVGAKGGTGKSKLTSLFADYLDREGVPYQCFDCDGSTKTISHLYPDDDRVSFYEIRQQRDLDSMLQAAIDAPEPIVLADMRAGSDGDFIPIFRMVLDEMSDELEDAELSVTAAAILANDNDSVFATAQWAKELRDDVRWLFVRNEIFGEVTTLEQTEEGRKLLQACNPLSITIPQLNTLDAEALKKNRLTVDRALKLREEQLHIEHLSGLAPQARLKKFRTTVGKEFERIFPELVHLSSPA